MLKRKVTLRQRKHLLTSEPVHPDAERALQALLNIGRQVDQAVQILPDQIDEVDLPLDEAAIEEAEAFEAAAINEIEDVHIEDDSELEDEDGDVGELIVC